MLDQTFESLGKFDWGTPLSQLSGIDDAVVASHADAALRHDVERRLIAALSTDISRDAKDYVCRKLAMIGSVAAVPSLAGLLPQEAHSHLARHSLERIAGPEAAAALKDALPKVGGKLKIGIIGSLAARGETSAVPALARLLGDVDPAVARSAAVALGTIGGPEATRVLQETIASADKQNPAWVDALLRCAESLVAEHKADQAAGIYQSLSGDDQPRLIRLAATRGLLTCLSART